jgi:hypothetical protein
MTRTGRPSSRSTSIRLPIWRTTPPLAASTSARSRVSAPVAGLVRTRVMVSPTAFWISAWGDSRSKSKFCSTIDRLSPVRVTVSGRI